MKSAKYFILNRLSGSLGRGILSIVLTQRLKRLLSRPVRFKLESSFSSNPNEMTPEEAVIISRLINFWNASQEFSSSTSSENSPWHDIERAQTKLSELMREGDSERIFQYLISAPSHAICNGVLQGDSETRMLRSNRRYRNLHSRITLNRFVNLLEGIGNGYLVQNPEQGIWGYGKDFDFNSALTQLDDEFGVEVIPPSIYNGLLQTKIGSRYFNQVDIMALNASLQIRNVLKGSHDKTILEIGAGCGVTAYWCTKLGLGPIQIVDLPHVAVLQAFYLLKVLPESNILLFGESHNLKTVDITIYPHLAFDQLPYQTSPRLVFNQDSFAEMSETVVKEYLKWIMKIEASFLLSINHESAATYNTLLVEQVILSKLIQLEPAFLPVYRHPNWVRMGYIDQLWRLR